MRRRGASINSRDRRRFLGSFGGSEQMLHFVAGFRRAEQISLHLGQPRSRNSSRCAAVSTPSATVVMLSAVAMLTTACTIEEELSAPEMSLTKQRSILILSNGKRF